ncbi:pyridoxal phosphate-dependent aminotransferase [Haloarchaeobius sp. TZWWS8]|uniref:pyridoxal phosphate-dependent aminotransferase n=1 Tax=Haloarchaeobius sp. TZWWS8 TaxID=3446121 RepID=UPI003EBBB4CC
MFPAIAYLEWIDGRPEAAEYDLGSSDLRGTRSEQFGPIPGRLAGLDDPPASLDLRSQLAEVYDVDSENVLLTPGATTANFVAIATALTAVTGEDDESGDDEPERDPQVLVEKPGYEPLRATSQALGGRVDRFLRPAEDDYRLDPERIGSALADDAALAITTNRHNPSGTLTDRETLAEAASVAGEYGIPVLVDEVYAPYTTTAEEGAFGGPTAAGLDGAVVTGSLTKFFGLGGLRLGWLVAEADFVSRARSVAWHIPALAEPSVTLGRRALAHKSDLEPVQRDLCATNHEQLASFVESRPDVSGDVPAGSPFAFLSVDGIDGDELAARAWEEADLLVVPGRFFEIPDAVRVSLGRAPEEGAAALERFGELLDSLA